MSPTMHQAENLKVLKHLRTTHAAARAKPTRFKIVPLCARSDLSGSFVGVRLRERPHRQRHAQLHTPVPPISVARVNSTAHALWWLMGSRNDVQARANKVPICQLPARCGPPGCSCSDSVCF